MENQALNKIEYKNEEPKVNTQLRLKDIFGNIKTTETIPVGLPNKLVDQIVILNNATSHSMFISDLTNNTWFFVDLKQL